MTMKLLYVTSNVSIPGTSGDATHVIEECTALAKQRIGKEPVEVFNITYQKKGQKNKEVINNFTTYRIKKTKFLPPLFLFFQTFLLSFWLILTKKIDVVYERGKLFGGGGLLAGFLTFKKRYLEFNEPIIDALIFEGRLKKGSLKERILSFWMNWNICISNAVIGTHESIFKGIKKKHFIIHWGANTEKFNPNNEKAEKTKKIKKKLKLNGITFYYIGSFAPWHLVENIVLAGGDIVKKYPKVKFVLIGKKGEKGRKVEELIKKNKLEKNFVLIEKIPYKDVPFWTASSDACLALFDANYPPFKKFSFFYSPIKIHEYLASGKPVITTNIGNLKKIIKDNYNGLLVSGNDLDSLKNAMIKIIKNKKLREQLSKNARISALKTYSWDVVARKTINFFTQKNLRK